MTIGNLFFNENRQIRCLWRILIFVSLLGLTILPLLLLNNVYLQFIGVLLILIFGLRINSKYLDKRNFSEYGLVFNKETFRNVLVGLTIGFCAVVLILIIGKSTGILSFSGVLSVPKGSLLVLFAFKMLLVGVLEETFFRGYLFTNLYDGFNSKRLTKKQTLVISLMLSSVLFGLAHFSNNNASFLSMTLLTVNGMVWCIPFIISKNLGLSIGLHTAWNFTQTQLGFTMSGNKSLNALYKIENVGPDLFTGGEYGPEAGILGLIGFGLMLAMSLLYLKYRYPKQTLLNKEQK